MQPPSKKKPSSDIHSPNDPANTKLNIKNDMPLLNSFFGFFRKSLFDVRDELKITVSHTCKGVQETKNSIPRMVKEIPTFYTSTTREMYEYYSLIVVPDFLVSTMTLMSFWLSRMICKRLGCTSSSRDMTMSFRLSASTQCVFTSNDCQ